MPIPIRSVSFSGRAAGISGVCPAITFTVGSRSVYTNADTNFKKLTCGTLRNGDDVQIKGTEMSDGRVRADEIKED